MKARCPVLAPRSKCVPALQKSAQWACVGLCALYPQGRLLGDCFWAAERLLSALQATVAVSGSGQRVGTLDSSLVTHQEKINKGSEPHSADLNSR